MDSREEYTRVATATTATTTKTVEVTTAVAKSRQQNGLHSDSLSVVTSAVATTTTTATNTSAPTGPTTVANDSTCAAVRQESFSPTTTAVTVRAPVGEEPICVESVSASEQQQKEMKLNEPSIAFNGDHSDQAIVIQNGTKNGHHHPEDDKENLNGGVVEPLTAKFPLKDGNYFLQVLKNEQKRLYAMAADIEKEIEQLKVRLDGWM